jgi:hypothetical protein
MCVGLHSRKKKKVGVLFLLIYGVSLQAHLCWFLFFRKIDGNVTPIGALDYGRMRSCTYIKEDNSARNGLSGGGLELRKRKLSFLCFYIIGVVIGVVL